MSRPRPASERIHSKLSPSGAGRWLPCPGSVALSEQAPPEREQTGPNAADEGTAAHKLLELCLTHKVKKAPMQWEGEDVEGYEVTEEMAAAVEVATDYIRGIPNTVDMLVELLLPIPELNTPGNPGQGHVDVAVLTTDALYVIDYKHGQGVPVEAKANEQLRLYTHGVIRHLNTSKIKIPSKIVNVIIQPRCPHPDGRIREDILTLKELKEFMTTVSCVVKDIVAGSGVLNPGEKHCRWCPAKAICPALAKRVIESAQQDFGDFINPEVDVQPVPAGPLTPAQLSVAMDRIDLIKMWVKSVEETVFALLDDGKDVPNYKLVEGRSNRKWRSEEDAMRWFNDNKYNIDKYAPRSLVGIGAAEKILPPYAREETMKLLTVKGEGKPTVAVLSDPRPAIRGSSPAEDFSDLLQ